MRMVVNEKRHYKMYKKGRLWVIAGITVATVGAGKLTAQAAAAAPVDSAVQAGQTDGVSVARPKQVTLTTPKVVAENENANNEASTPATPVTAAPAESAATPSESTATEPSSAPASSTSAVTPTSSAAPSAADSVAPTQPQSGGSAGTTSAPETDQSAAPTSVAPASKPAAATSKVAPVQPVTTKASARAVEADTGDEDVSGQFDDANLLAAVRKGLKLADDQVLTVNVIKAQKSSISVSIKDGDDYLPVKSLKGLQLLGNLNDGVYVNVDLELGSTPEELRAIDLSPLQALKLNGLHLITDYWRYATDDQLKLIAGLDTSAINGATFTRANTLQANNTGLNNHQFAILAPFIQGVFEANTPVWSVVVSVAGNNITDFSPLKNISPQKRGGMLTAWFQYGWNVDPIPFKAGETMIVTSPLTDIYGDSINYNVRYYQDDGTESGKLVVADAFQEEATTSDGATRMVWKYKLVNPKITNGMVRYGQWGTGDVARPEYTTDSQGNPMESFQLNTGMHVIQYVTESQASLTFNPSEVVMGPDASWNYVDHINTATDYDGNLIDASQWPNLNIQQVSTLDLASAGQQTVRFAYTDEQNNVFYVDAVVDVVASQAAITAGADQIVWPSEVSGLTAADLVASVTDATGQALTDFSAVTMTAVDPVKAGAQPVTLSYTDVAGNVVTATAYVTVDLASLTTTATEVVVGPNASWDYLTAITAATDSNGQTIDGHNADVQVVTPPDLSTAKIGVPQTVVLAYTDNLGRTQTVNATVTTLKSQAILAGTDLTLIAGPNATWQLADSVDLAHSLDASGQPLTTADLTKITADTRPDVQIPGDYPLTLRYVDAAGQPLALTDLTVTGKVTTNRPGTYQVTYQYTDDIGNVVTATATVTVVDPETPIEPENPEEPKEPEQPGEGDGIQDGDNQQNDTGTGQETTAGGDRVDGQNSTTSQGKQSVDAESLTLDTPATMQPASAKAQASATSLPQTDETPRGALAVLAGVLGLSSLVAGVGATRRRRDR